MCLIVDANTADLVASGSPDSPFYPILEALLRTMGLRARLVVGGKLAEELARTKLRTVIDELSRAGRLRRVESEKIDSHIDKIKSVCTSNDVHVIALARAGKVKLLCSNDRALSADFKNSKLIRQGKVYRKPEHKHLIADCCGGVT